MTRHISLASKNIFHEKVRLLISVGGVAFAVLLIVILLGLYRGWSETLSEYIEAVNADVWVMQDGSIDMSHSISILPNNTADMVRAIDGVNDVNVIVGNRITFDINGEEVTSRVVGFDTVEKVGGPAAMIEGEAIPSDQEIIIDEIVWNNYGVTVGDTITINDTDFTVSGVASGGPLFQQSYVRIEDAKELFHMQDYINFIMVDVEQGAVAAKVMERIEEQINGVDAQTSEEFATNNEREIMDKFLPIIFVLVFIGFIVGVMIISLTIYTATIERAGEYGVLKAIGSSNSYLYRVVLVQAAIAGGLGYACGAVLAVVSGTLIKRVEPLFVTLFTWQDLLTVAGVVLGMVLVAGYVPVRRIVSIDPAEVFKA